MEAATITRTETKLALIFERYITVLVNRGPQARVGLQLRPCGSPVSAVAR